MCRPRTSRDISSYSPPAFRHFRYKALQKVTTMMIFEGEAPKLIVLDNLRSKLIVGIIGTS